jgi:hypothetical protein
MKLRLKEDPREWRKSVWLLALGLAVLSSILRWRRVISAPAWLEIVSALALISAAAGIVPRAFRGYYRVSMRAGYALSQAVARVVLVFLFVLVITPLALVFRLLGKDPLRLRRSKEAATYWEPAREKAPLDTMF